MTGEMTMPGARAALSGMLWGNDFSGSIVGESGQGAGGVTMNLTIEGDRMEGFLEFSPVTLRRVPVSAGRLAWYLMFPPVDGGVYLSDAPLSKWRVHVGHDSARECEIMKHELFNRAEESRQEAERAARAKGARVPVDDEKWRVAQTWVGRHLVSAVYRLR